MRIPTLATVCCAVILAPPRGEAKPPQGRCDSAALTSGLEAYRNGDRETAIARLRPLVAQVEACPIYRDAVAALGMSHYFKGQYEEAVPLLDQAVSWAPARVELSYTLGLCHLRKRDVNGARQAFARLFGVASGSAQARLLTARIMMRERMEDLAAIELAPAVELDPKLPEVHFLLGELAIYRGDPEAGIAEMEKELSLNPSFAMAYYRLGDAYTRKESWDEAVAPLQKSIWLNPDFSSPYILLAKVYHRKGEMRLAEGLLKRALAMDPNNGPAHYLLGSVYRETGRAEDARKEFELYRKAREVDLR